MNYRKIWEQHYGDIPTDINNVTYDIHHIDGNQSNNCIQNLKAVSLQEHYNIHFEQGDYMACFGISSRMFANNKQKSIMISLFQKKLVQEGRHHFLDKEKQKERAKKAVASGKLPKFTSNNDIQIKAQKTHKKLTEKGIHPFQLHNSSKIEWTCEKCGKTGKGSANYKRYHGEGCRYVS